MGTWVVASYDYKCGSGEVTCKAGCECNVPDSGENMCVSFVFS
jgi:hypothetical protein